MSDIFRVFEIFIWIAVSVKLAVYVSQDCPNGVPHSGRERNGHKLKA